MVKEIIQDRKQGMRIEFLLKQKALPMEVIAKKLGATRNRIAKVIWGERRDAVIREGIAMLLGFNSWKALSIHLQDDKYWEAK